MYIYILLCVFSLVLDRDLLEDINDVKSRHITSAELFLSFSIPPKSGKIVNKVFELLLYKANRFHFDVVCSVIDAQMTSERGKNKKVAHERESIVRH